MDGFLEGQYAGEILENDGAFTLKSVSSSDLAKRFRLPEPRAYILKLIQWAVSSSPRVIKVDTAGDELKLKHDGRPLTSEQLDNLARGVIDFRHLSVGVYGALTLNPTRLTVASRGRALELVSGESRNDVSLGGEWTEVIVSGASKRLWERSPKVAEYLRNNWARTSFNGAVQGLILNSMGLGSLESSLICTFCGACPVPLELNGKFLNSFAEPVAGGYHGVWDGETLNLVSKPTSAVTGTFLNYCFSEAPGEVLAPLKPVVDRGAAVYRNRWLRFPEGDRIEASDVNPDLCGSRLKLNGGGLFRAQAIHRPDSRGSGFFNVYLVKDGVFVDEYRECGPSLSGYALMSAGELKSSADGFTLVRDDAFEKMKSALGSIIVANQISKRDFDSLVGPR